MRIDIINEKHCLHERLRLHGLKYLDSDPYPGFGHSGCDGYMHIGKPVCSYSYIHDEY